MSPVSPAAVPGGALASLQIHPIVVLSLDMKALLSYQPVCVVSPVPPQQDDRFYCHCRICTMTGSLTIKLFCVNGLTRVCAPSIFGIDCKLSSLIRKEKDDFRPAFLVSHFVLRHQFPTPDIQISERRHDIQFISSSKASKQHGIILPGKFYDFIHCCPANKARYFGVSINISCSEYIVTRGQSSA